VERGSAEQIGFFRDHAVFALIRDKNLKRTNIMPALYCLLGFGLAAVHAVVILRYVIKAS
jgi:hypothetical protein